MRKLWRVKQLAGELRRTEVRRNTGFQLTTKEFILQKEDMAYHIALEDILGVIEDRGQEPFPDAGLSGETRVTAPTGPEVVKIVAVRMRIHRPSGTVETGAGTLHVRLSAEFRQQLLNLLHAQHGSGKQPLP